MKPAHVLHITVRLRDLDGLRHVNNATVVSWLEDVRTDYLMSRRNLRRIEDVDFILARTEIDYRSPAWLDEEIEIAVWPVRIGTRSFDLRYRIRERATGRVVAEAVSVLVSYDYAAGRPMPVPEALRAVLEKDLAAAGD